ncbi:MAG: hypothetical protein AMDU5_GPLC00005G0001 [Thermoplasmatales archaeon Gpl]|nr:MAG: hypothetical protein AMDU5_GPLC00005G0001 [Thermoplasmatales archaeon Gpl]
MRCLGVVDIDQSAVRNSEDKVQDPFDPMNTPALPGMTKEEIMDLMVEKMIQKGKEWTRTPRGSLKNCLIWSTRN